MAGSILETFLILFESDSKEVKKGAEEAGKSTKELEAKLKSSGNASKELGSEFLRTARAAVGAITAILSVEAAIHGIERSLEFAHSMSEAAEAIDVNASELTAWAAAAEVTGASADDFVGTVKNLTSAMTQLDVVGKSRVKPFFDQLGIKMLDVHGKVRPVLDLFPELASAFEKMSKQESFGLGQKMGLSEATIMFLQRGRAAVDDLVKSQKELGELVKKYGPETQKLAEAWDKARLSWRAALLSLSGDSLSGLTAIAAWLDRVGKWVQAHGDFVKKFLWGVAGGLTAVAIASGILLAPWVLILGAILLVSAAFALILDDIDNFLQGNDSAIGRLRDLYWQFIAWLVRGFQWCWDQIKDGWNSVVAWFQAKKEDFLRGFYYIRDGILEIFENIKKHILDTIQAIIDAVQKIKNWLGLGDDNTITINGTISDGRSSDAGSNLYLGKSAIGQADSSPLAAQSGNSLLLGASAGSSISKSNSVSIGEINIQTQATDADGIAAAAKETFSREMRQTSAQFDDGIHS